MSDKFSINDIIVDTNPTTITFEADDYKVTKRQAEITYEEPLFLQQFHTMIFKINGEELRFERK